ncbi:uncharacterized protein LOC115244768 [Formica exsecta]|uniref:uncharacterized protein LOC115244768 n=1 Tax=Formica exsecta TaxID=72781 RepID=UPI0011438327|nr:uncharacterized protein LOC115244768 [Formica exsecta]
MYRQILVAPEDRHLQKILWRHSDKAAPQEYELDTVTYGMACAPFLAMRTLRQLADDEAAHFPKGSAALRRDVYVDDILTGTPTIEEAMDLQRQLTELCTAGLDWDTPLADADTQLWSKFHDDFPSLEEIRVPRHILLSAAHARIELHGFADASERAYTAVIYARTETCNGQKYISLVSAKTKVAPLKTVTLPRLEVCAASLFTKLAAHVQRVLEAGNAPIHLWSDSTVALCWIRGHPSRWKVYVANRVTEIQTTLPGAQWHHLPGTENPADCASQGISPSELVTHPLWWKGLPWLMEDRASWPDSRDEELAGELPEERVRALAATAPPAEATEPEELTRFSSLNRLLRVTAWCRRWSRPVAAPRAPPATEQPPTKDTLSAAEYDDARLTWIRVVQAETYNEELKTLARGAPLSKSNPLIKLTPFLDPQGILRVGGRLKHALLAYDERHPLILPSSSHFRRLTLGPYRQHYWIPRGRQLIKEVIQRCVTCVRWRAATQQQIMGDLPRLRVTPARPFLCTGVDYAGPIQLRTTKGHGHRAHKAFIAVFVCLSMKAVQLEVVSDYSADAFLAALRRFTARRGLCRSLHSDCGTNFVGVDTQLRTYFTASSPEQRKIADQMANEQIKWCFNPPSAPHFGGLWEAAVKSCKHHLRRVDARRIDAHL